MVEYCPIVKEKVDEKLIRINAMFIFSLLVLYNFMHIDWLIFVIVADFAIRVFWGVRNSPVCKMIKHGLNIVGTKQYLVNAGPKKLASKVGFLFSVLIILFQFLEYDIAKYIVSFVFLIATFLEVFFKFCLVCRIYPYLNKLGLG